MTPLSRFLSFAAIAATVGLTSCGSLLPGADSPRISPTITSLPVNSLQVFSTTAGSITIANAVNNGFDFGPGGILSYAAGSTSAANVVTYLSPATPPVYPYPLPAGVVQGSVTLEGYDIIGGQTSLSFFITAPSITIGLVPATVTMPRNSSQQFNGYAVGNLNNAITWQVNGVTGGSSATGYITAAGLYTAPANIPMTGSTVTITVLSQADPAKTAVSTVTIS